MTSLTCVQGYSQLERLLRPPEGQYICTYWVLYNSQLERSFSTIYFTIYRRSALIQGILCIWQPDRLFLGRLTTIFTELLRMKDIRVLLFYAVVNRGVLRVRTVCQQQASNLHTLLHSCTTSIMLCWHEVLVSEDCRGADLISFEIDVMWDASHITTLSPQTSAAIFRRFLCNDIAIQA